MALKNFIFGNSYSEITDVRILKEGEIKGVSIEISVYKSENRIPENLFQKFVIQLEKSTEIAKLCNKLDEEMPVVKEPNRPKILIESRGSLSDEDKEKFDKAKENYNKRFMNS